MDMTVKIGLKVLPNPVGVASGTFGYGSEYDELMDLSRIGALYTKAVTLEPRAGNDIPRMVETPSGILNSIGLANVGVKAFLTEKMPYLSTLSCPVIVNVAGSTEEEYAAVVEKLESAPGIWGYEINVSCPNVHQGGLSFGIDPVQVERLTKMLRPLTGKPLIVKLTPNVTHIAVIARAAEQGGADAVSCINTLVGMVIDVRAKKTVLAAKTGGLSGPAVRPVGVALTYRVKQAVKVPVIGMGGITNADDALQYLLAGASAVQIGTANFVDPQSARNVLDGLLAYGKQEGISCIADLHRFIP